MAPLWSLSPWVAAWRDCIGFALHVFPLETTVETLDADDEETIHLLAERVMPHVQP
jgi:hypothetical protein